MALDENQISEIKSKLLSQLSNLPEDKRSAVKNQIEQMNSSQLEAFLKQNVKMDDCVFCAIVEGNTESYKVYEDDIFVCVLSIKPLVKGHLLLIPKNHDFSNKDLLLKKGEELGNKIKSVFPDSKIEYKLESMFGHNYLSVLPASGEGGAVNANKGYFETYQKIISESINAVEEELPEEILEEKPVKKILPKFDSRIP